MFFFCSSSDPVDEAKNRHTIDHDQHAEGNVEELRHGVKSGPRNGWYGDTSYVCLPQVFSSEKKMLSIIWLLYM